MYEYLLLSLISFILFFLHITFILSALLPTKNNSAKIIITFNSNKTILLRKQKAYRNVFHFRKQNPVGDFSHIFMQNFPSLLYWSNEMKCLNF